MTASCPVRMSETSPRVSGSTTWWGRPGSGIVVLDPLRRQTRDERRPAGANEGRLPGGAQQQALATHAAGTDQHLRADHAISRKAALQPHIAAQQTRRGEPLRCAAAWGLGGVGGGRAGGQGHGMVAGSATSKALMGSERDKKLSVTEAHAAQGSSEASIMIPPHRAPIPQPADRVSAPAARVVSGQKGPGATVCKSVLQSTVQ